MSRLSKIIKNYPLVFVVLGLLIFFTIILVISAFNMHPTVEVELLVAPTSATTTIDGKSYQNGTFKIAPGEHQVHIEKEGFVSQDFSFNTLSTNKVYAYLRQTDGSFSWYRSHPEDSQVLTKIGDYLADQEATNYTRQNPITQALPIIYANYDDHYNYTEYRIDGGKFDSCQTDFCIKITDSTGGNLELAKQKIRDSGFNPDDYQIIYEYKPVQAL